MGRPSTIKTGETFGFLTVLRYAEKGRWECLCICGRKTYVAANRLKTSKQPSCGCKRKGMLGAIPPFIGGEVFGYLTVEKYNRLKHAWECKCICGRITLANAAQLRKGQKKSCGCKKVAFIMKAKTVIADGTVYKNFVVNRFIGNGIYECTCSCGKLFTATGGSIRARDVTSCGCARNSDYKELAVKYNKHPATILDAKRKLFGRRVSVLTTEQEEKLSRYFETTEMNGVSLPEKEVLSFVKELVKEKIETNDRKTIAPKELDVYIPNKKVAIEYNGLRFHSTQFEKGSMYHLDKTKACQEKGIRLIHVYENEWRDKQDIVKSMIASALGVYERKIYARNCEIREVTDKEAVKKLFDENHVQGAVNRYELCLGLYYKDELVQACVFGKQHFGRNGDIELYRMVTVKNTQVLGGFSKIMKHCPYNKVVSYVSLRHFDAKGYYNSGWTLDHVSPPSFDIVKDKKLYSRHLFKKQQCLKMFDNVTPDMTEQEMQELNGFYRIYDCGTYKVVWDRTLIEKKN